MSLEDPRHVVQLLVDGMLALERDPAAGEAQIAAVCAKSFLDANGRIHDRGLIDRLVANRRTARSYLGGTPANDYAVADDAKIAIDTSNPHAGVDYPEPGHAKFFLACGGADSSRPLELRKNAKGEWKVWSWSSLTIGVKPAASTAGDF